MAGSESMARWKRKHQGTWETHHGLRRKRSTQAERTIHKQAEAVVGVGLAGSTQNMGKPRTRGSGKAE